LELSVPRILVVDDSPIDRAIIVDFLTPLPCTFTVAENGEQALAMVREAPPSIILLDIVMPGKNGFQVCRELKADPATRDVPVIFLTSRSAVHDTLEGFRAGAVDYVCKPYEPEELLARVNTHIELCNRIQREHALVERLQKALDEVKTLSDLIPICAWCRRVRDDHGYWQQVEAYFASHGKMKFSHGVCPECQTKHFPETLDRKHTCKSFPKP
jgi:CheY-like chemotaxis protein